MSDMHTLTLALTAYCAILLTILIVIEMTRR